MTRDDKVATVIETVDLISKKWHPAIIQTLLESGPLRFNELQSRLDGISGKVLTDSLSDLVEADLVERTVVSESPKRVEYELTAHGRDLQSAIEALATWGDRHLGEDSRPKVLVVDDDPRLADMHAEWLAERYDVETAYSGEDALRKLTEDVDLLLLDRRMAGIGGEEVLERIELLGVDCGVIMLTAVEPDFDIVALGFDEYLVKPGVKQTVLEAAEDVLERTSLDSRFREYLALAAKRALLRAELPTSERERDERYARLTEQLERLERDLDDPARALTRETVQEMLPDEPGDDTDES